MLLTVFYSDSVPTTFEFKNDLRLTNMQQIELHLPDKLSADINRFLSKIIAHSSNLTTMITYAGNRENFIQQMSSIIPVGKKKQIIYLDLALLRDFFLNYQQFCHI